MRLAVLFSGGKDSAYAMYKAMQEHEVVCLVTLKSKNPDSYMFHTPNIELTELQSEALNLPLLTTKTQGKKEDELDDLREAIKKAVEFFHIEGVVTGAIESVYQASRIQKTCNEIGLWCFSPLWKKDQIELLKELVENKFKVMIVGIAAYPFEKEWLGKTIDKNTISKLSEFKKKYKINPAGEGGEYESFVYGGPIFKKEIIIKDYKTEYKNHAGSINSMEASLK